MTKRKTFKDNESYFEFYNKNREKIKILKVNMQKNKTILEYEVLDNDITRT